MSRLSGPASVEGKVEEEEDIVQETPVHSPESSNSRSKDKRRDSSRSPEAPSSSPAVETRQSGETGIVEPMDVDDDGTSERDSDSAVGSASEITRPATLTRPKRGLSLGIHSGGSVH
jgi:hypothetical protein